MSRRRREHTAAGLARMEARLREARLGPDPFDQIGYLERQHQIDLTPIPGEGKF